MTQTVAADRWAPELEGPQPESLEARASTALKVLAVINVAGMILAMFPGLVPVAMLHTATFNLAAGLLAALELVVATRIDRRRPWATAALRPLLILLAVAGVYSVVVSLAAGTIRLPFETALAVWAWLGKPDALDAPVPRLGARSIASVVVAAALIASMLFGHQVFGWGGALDVKQEDLQASITVECGEPGAGPPASIAIRYDWSWTRTSPLASGLDIVVIGWTGQDGTGSPMYLFDTVPGSGAGVYPGRRTAPSIDMSNVVAAESEGSWPWGLELRELSYQPGRIELLLRRVKDAPPDPEPLVIKATYIHLGIWRNDAASVTCSW